MRGELEIYSKNGYEASFGSYDVNENAHNDLRCCLITIGDCAIATVQ